MEIDVRSSVAGWDDHGVYVRRIRNYSGKPIDVEIRRLFPGHAIFRSSLTAKNHDYRTVEYKTSVPAGKQAGLLYEVVQHQGRNKKQDNVTLEKAEIER